MALSEPWVWAELKSLLPPQFQGVAVDVGAHEGEWAGLLATLFPLVWAFEAQMDLAVHLVETLPANVKVLPIALAESSGVRLFTHYPNSAHFSAKFDVGGINTGKAQGQACLVCQPLDLFQLDDVQLVKVDVEGLEGEVLLGGQHTITLERPLLVLEIHSVAAGNRITELLQSWQYGVRKIVHPAYRSGSENAERHYWLIGVP